MFHLCPKFLLEVPCPLAQVIPAQISQHRFLVSKYSLTEPEAHVIFPFFRRCTKDQCFVTRNLNYPVQTLTLNFRTLNPRQLTQQIRRDV